MSWNLRGAAGYNIDDHAAAWEWIRDQGTDVALVQEAVLPVEVDASWRFVMHRPKYSGPVQWGTAVLTKASTYEAFEPTPEYPWLKSLQGSVVIARPTVADAPWLISLHSNASPVSPDRTAAHDLRGVHRCDPRVWWEIDLIAHDLARLLAGKRFVAGGDLNSSLLFDDGKAHAANAALFANLAGAGFVDTRSRFHAAEQRTWFKKGQREFQLDHVYADGATETAVTGWAVDTTVAGGERPLSDHAPVLLDVGYTETGAHHAGAIRRLPVAPAAPERRS